MQVAIEKKQLTQRTLHFPFSQLIRLGLFYGTGLDFIITFMQLFSLEAVCPISWVNNSLHIATYIAYREKCQKTKRGMHLHILSIWQFKLSWSHVPIVQTTALISQTT